MNEAIIKKMLESFGIKPEVLLGVVKTIEDLGQQIMRIENKLDAIIEALNDTATDNEETNGSDESSST